MCVQRVSDWLLLTFPLETELILNTHTIVTDIRQDVSKIREDSGRPNQVVSGVHSFYHPPNHANRCLGSEQVSDFDYHRIRCLTSASSVSGEPPPPPPRAFSGRDELINRIICFAECLTPVAPRRNRQGLHRPDRPSRSSDQTTIWPGSAIHPL